MKRSSSRCQRESEFFALEAAGAEGDHEFGAAGDGGVVVGRVGEDLQDRVERVGGDEVVLR